MCGSRSISTRWRIQAPVTQDPSGTLDSTGIGVAVRLQVITTRGQHLLSNKTPPGLSSAAGNQEEELGKEGRGPSPVLCGTEELHPRVGAAAVRSWRQVHGLGEAGQQQLQQLRPWRREWGEVQVLRIQVLLWAALPTLPSPSSSPWKEMAPFDPREAALGHWWAASLCKAVAGSLPQPCGGQAWGPARHVLWAPESSPVHVVDVVGLGRVSEAHARLPDVFATVQGVHVLRQVLGTGSESDRAWGGQPKPPVPRIIPKTDSQMPPLTHKGRNECSQPLGSAFPPVWLFHLLSPV